MAVNKFNLTLFNGGVNQKIIDLPFGRNAIETQELLANISNFRVFLRNSTTIFNAKTDLQAIIGITRDGRNRISGSDGLRTVALFSRMSREEIRTSTNATKIIKFSQINKQTFDAHASFAKNLLLARNITAPLCAEVVASKITAARRNLTELFFSVPNALVAETVELSINMEIAPNGEILIDVENFEAIYQYNGNKSNILHLLKGEWPQLSRNIQRIYVDSGKGIPQVFFEYRDKYI